MYGDDQKTKRSRATKRMIFTYTKPVHQFSRGYQALILQGNAVHSPYLNAFDTQLQYLPNFTEFTTLYDEYRIDMVEFTFYLKNVPGNSSTVTEYPLLHYCIDNDDSGVPANLDEIRQHSNAKCVQLTEQKPIRIRYKPSVAQEIYRTAVTTAYASKSGIFVDAASNNVPHYGLKFGLDSFLNPGQFMSVQARVWLSGRAAR